MPGSRDAGIAQRFEGYLNALERVGRRYRRRLDLRTRDPIVSPICQAIRELQDLSRRCVVLGVQEPKFRNS